MHDAALEAKANTEDQQFLELAIELARLEASEGGIPIGAILVADGVVLGTGRNRRIQLGSPIRHGEAEAREAAGRLSAQVYRSSAMYTTLSPCDMCSGAIPNRRLVCGDWSWRFQIVITDRLGYSTEVLECGVVALIERLAATVPEHPMERFPAC